MRNQNKQRTKLDFNIDRQISLYDYFDGQVPVVSLITIIFTGVYIKRIRQINENKTQRKQKGTLQERRRRTNGKQIDNAGRRRDEMRKNGTKPATKGQIRNNSRTSHII